MPAKAGTWGGAREGCGKKSAAKKQEEAETLRSNTPSIVGAFAAVRQREQRAASSNTWVCSKCTMQHNYECCLGVSCCACGTKRSAMEDHGLLLAPAAQPIVPFAPALGASLLVEGPAAIPAAADVGDAMRGDAPAVGLGQGQSVVPSAPALGALLLMEAATVDPSAAPADGPDTMDQGSSVQPSGGSVVDISQRGRGRFGRSARAVVPSAALAKCLLSSEGGADPSDIAPSIAADPEGTLPPPPARPSSEAEGLLACSIAPIGAQVTEPSTGEAGVLQLSGIFTELTVSALNGQLALYKRAMDGQRATTSALFQEQYAALEKKETELRELAQEVEAERKRIQGRDSLRDLTDAEAWLGFKPGGAVFCRICSRFLSQSMFSHHSAVTNQWIDYNPTCGQINHFALTPSMMRQKVGEHLDSPMHAACVLAKATAAESAQAQLKINKSSAEEAKLEHDTMERVFRTAMHCAKHKRAFLEFENLVFLQDMNGCMLGQGEHSRITAATMIDIAAQVGIEQIRMFLTTPNPCMNGHLPHVTWKADKICDVTMRQFECANIRVNWQGTPVQIHLEMGGINGDYADGGGEGGSSPEAGSLVCFNKILEVHATATGVSCDHS